MGVVSASGLDLPTFWERVREGRSSAVPVTRFPTKNLPSRIAAEIQGFNALQFLDSKKARRLELAIQYGLIASRLALKDSGLKPETMDADRVGVVEATSVGGMESTLNAHLDFLERGYKGMSPFTFINAYCGGGSGEIALELGIKGHAITYCSGSCSGNDAMGYALSMIRDDEVDVMVAGGAEAPLLEGLWNGFCVTKVMTRSNEAPLTAMRPFDQDRDGFLLGEGAAFVVMEELSHALARGAHIYAEVAGHGRSCEAYHSVAPHPEGTGLYRAMQKALRNARMDVSDVDYINAHGTATETNDLVETRALRKLFQDGVKNLSVSSTKPVTGHLLGASGALETVVCALAVHHEVIPPTINLQNPAEGCDLDYVPQIARPYPIRAAMNVNVGFGGKNSCLILRRLRTEP